MTGNFNRFDKNFYFTACKKDRNRKGYQVKLLMKKPKKVALLTYCVISYLEVKSVQAKNSFCNG